MEAKSFDYLPFDVVVEIFQYLSFEELVSSGQYVCARWQNIIQDPLFWKDITYKPSFGMTTEDVVTLLQKAPLLKKFEFREGIEAPKIIDVLCENKNITSISFDVYMPSGSMLGELLINLPNLEYLQIPLVSFFKFINIICKFPKLKTVKCTQLYHDSLFYSGDERSVVVEGSDWQALETLDVCSDHGVKFTEFIVHVQNKLRSLEVHALQSSGILEHIPNCIQLEKLKLNFLSRQREEDVFLKLLRGLRNLKNLKYLCLATFVHADANVLCKVFENTKFSKLTELDLSHCLNFTPRAVQNIVAACPQLSVVYLEGSTVVDDLCLRELGQCSKLSVLDISGCRAVTEIGLSHLASCRFLHKLYINWIGLLSFPMLKEIAKLKRLTSLHLDHTEANMILLLDCLHKLPILHFLSVYDVSGVSGEVVANVLCSCSVKYANDNLKSVLKRNVNQMQKVKILGAEDNVLASVPDYDTTEENTIDFLLRPCNSFPDVFVSLWKSKNLQTLSLKRFTTSENGLLCRLFDGGLPFLRTLELEHCWSVDQDVAASVARNFPQLEKLNLKGCIALNNEGLAAIVQIQCLRELDISNCSGITTSGLVSLKHCKHLQDLNICGLTHVSKEVMKCILSLPELRILHADFSDFIKKYIKGKDWKLKLQDKGIAEYVNSKFYDR